MIDNWHSYMGGNKYQVKWDRLCDRKFDNTKIGKYIDISTFKDTQVALSECLESFIQNPQFKQINWKHEALKDKVTGEWTKIREIPSAKKKIVYFFVRIGVYK